MPYHRFKIGQTVAMPSPVASPEPCTIIRLLPLVGNEPLYRVRSMLDGQEKALPEGQIVADTPAKGRLWSSRTTPEHRGLR